MSSEYILLKWGTIKSWNLVSEDSIHTMKKYFQSGTVMNSVAMQKDNSDQKQVLCDLIDGLQGKIQNDWTGDYMSKEEAKDYITNYRGQ